MISPRLPLLLSAFCLSLATARAEAPASPIPDGSAMAGAKPEMPRVLLNAMDAGDVITAGGDNIRFPQAVVDKGVETKFGQEALKLEGNAAFGGARADFYVSKWPAGHTHYLGAWIYLTPESNVDKVGFQVVDGEMETLGAYVPADWKGWKWVEFDLQKEKEFQPAGQAKNGHVDVPLNEVHISWFAKGKGPTFVDADSVMAVADYDPNERPYLIQTTGPNNSDANTPFTGRVIINNLSNKPVDVDVNWSLQTNPLLYDKPLPDTKIGSNRAVGCKDWIELDGKKIENNTLTDGETSTDFGSDWITDHFTEGFQYVDLGKERKIVHLEYHAGNAGKTHKVDVAASTDGTNYTPVEGLQDYTLEQRWGMQTFPVKEPFSARYIRLRYHNDGKKLNFIQCIAELYVYDGATKEESQIPHTGDMVDQKTLHVTVPAASYSLTQIASSAPLKTGGYYYGIKADGSRGTDLLSYDYFIRSATEIKPRPEGRVGMNVAVPDYAPELVRLGMSWVRFENMKWRFYNNAPDQFSFDGSVDPFVPLDYCMEEYHKAGLSILPYLFLPPDWATSAPASVERGRWANYPPKNFDDYGKSVFEAVARYGTTKHAPDELHTKDKTSGLGWITTWEIWNEPNNDPSWGCWAAPFEKYLDIFRIGAEAVKKGDPNSKVTTAGFSGLSMQIVDQLRTYKYADGKAPIDFADILNVHFYSGRQEPEYTVDDPNANRNGEKPGTETYEDNLVDLSDWRDQVKPGMPIWLTETGNDVGGPIGRSERYQAAKIPRDLMIALATGMDKVMLYREVGSDESMHAGSGVFRNDKTIRPSYFTLATMTHQLDSVTDIHTLRLKTADPKVWLYNWKRANDHVLTAWTPVDTVPLGLDLGKCHVVDSFGTESDVEVNKDFPLSIFPVYITQITHPEPIAALEKEAVATEDARKKVRAFYLTQGHAYLYAFGGKENKTLKIVGLPHPYQPVLAADIYDDTKGYGFSAQGAKDDAKPWLHSALENNSVDFAAENSFKIKAAPGVYTLEVKAIDFPGDGKVSVTGTQEGNTDVPLKAGETAKAKVTAVSGQPVEVKLPANSKIQWLTLVQEPPAS